MSDNGIEGLGPRTVHLCVDMQRLFGEGTDWALEWMPRVLPNIERIAAAHAAQTIFTRFVPAQRRGEGHGMWRLYYERWASMTIERVGAEMVNLVPELQRYAPPAEVIDKPVYSPWHAAALPARLSERGVDTLVVTGGESDVCVLAAVLGAVDFGYRVILVRDALCSSSDETHDAMLHLFHRRYTMQVTPATTEEVMASW